MPGQFERHSRNAWEWGAVPGRSDLTRQAAADDPEPVKRSPGKKDTHTWCRGKVGAEHVKQLERKYRTGGRTTCGWFPAYRRKGFGIAWSCCHAEVCASCRKVFRTPWDGLTPQDCPLWPGTPGQQAAARAEAERWEQRQREWYEKHPRKPAVTGPQGYRKKKP
jgi:hypothetical protein